MTKCVTPVGRVAYPHLFKARKRNEKTEPRYSVSLVFDETQDLTAFKDAVRACIREEYPNGVPAGFSSPFKSGANRIDEEGNQIEGFKATDTYVEFWRYEANGRQPTVGPDRDSEGNLVELNPADVYAGCQGRVSFRPYCWGKGQDHGNKGVNCGLEAFQKTGDGKAIGNAPVNVNDAFAEAGAPKVPSAPAPAAADPLDTPAGPVSVDDLL